MRVECDADTRKIAERYIARATPTIRYSLWVAGYRAAARPAIEQLLRDVEQFLHGIETALDAAPFEPCGWTGDVADHIAWTCPVCLTEHVTPEPDGERDVSPADAAYYADRAADRYEQRLYGGA